MVAPESVEPGDGSYPDTAGNIDEQGFDSAEQPRVAIPEAPSTPKGHPDYLATSVLGMMGLITIGVGVKIATRHKKHNAGE